MNGTVLKALFSRIFALPAGLNERQQKLIRASFAKVLPIQEAVITLFYERLFILDPRLNALFRVEMTEKELMTAMKAVVDHSHCLGQLVPALRELARRHGRCGGIDRDYDIAAAAWIWTLEHELGADFTAETREAWTACCGFLAEEMKAAANEAKIPILPPC